jgi:hypothetical protein
VRRGPMQDATYRRTTCNIQPATGATQRATCSMRHAPGILCNMRRRSRSRVDRFAACCQRCSIDVVRSAIARARISLCSRLSRLPSLHVARCLPPTRSLVCFVACSRAARCIRPPAGGCSGGGDGPSRARDAQPFRLVARGSAPPAVLRAARRRHHRRVRADIQRARVHAIWEDMPRATRLGHSKAVC